MSNRRRFSLESLENRTVPATINSNPLTQPIDPNRHGTGNVHQVDVQLPDTGPNPSLTVDVGDSPSSQYVQKLYIDLLGRTIDNGAKPFIDALAAGQQTRHDVADQILHSDEYIRRQIDLTFQMHLGRHVDQASLDGFAQEVHDGRSLDQVTIEVLSSDEYRLHHAGNAQLVAALFQDVLGRQPDAPSAQVYADRVASADAAGMRDIVKELVGSSEAKSHRGAAAVALMIDHNPGAAVVDKFVAEAQDHSLEDLLADIASSEQFMATTGTTGTTGTTTTGASSGSGGMNGMVM